MIEVEPMIDAKTTPARAQSPRLWIATGVCVVVSVCAMMVAGSVGSWYTLANWVGVITMLAAGVMAGFGLLGSGMVDAASATRRRRLLTLGIAAVVVGVITQFLTNVLILNKVMGSAVWSLLVEAAGNAVIVIGAVFVAVALMGSREPEAPS